MLTRIYIVQRPPFLLDLDAGTQAAIEEIARAAYSGAKLVVDEQDCGYFHGARCGYGGTYAASGGKR